MRRLTVLLRVCTAPTHLLEQPPPPGSSQDTACANICRHAIPTGRLLSATLPDSCRRRASPAESYCSCCACGSAATGWACRHLRDAPLALLSSHSRSVLQEAYRTLGLPSRRQEDPLFLDRNLGPPLQSLVDYLDAVVLSSNF
ncbi:hypothetical protein HPB50_023681 [Hyalomma asiaticum]|uniref:Uncharacterized protein n=1 Tax=Hyalomma asiaticum TaxID=266040 RepID=A0ACB7T4N6_HYAAI|nr:hypothetical protein HPB50_023681 [Hyalomma asiaticum]